MKKTPQNMIHYITRFVLLSLFLTQCKINPLPEKDHPYNIQSTLYLQESRPIVHISRSDSVEMIELRRYIKDNELRFREQQQFHSDNRALQRRCEDIKRNAEALRDIGYTLRAQEYPISLQPSLDSNRRDEFRLDTPVELEDPTQ